MPDTPTVEPLQDAPATPQVESTQPPPDDATPAAQEAAPAKGLPPPLMKIPVFQALLAGAPPAVSLKLKGHEDRDDVKLITKNADTLQKAGFGFYRSMSGQFGVMFNAFHIHPQDIQAADAAGKLQAVAPDFDEINHAMSKAGRAHPLLNVQRVPTTLASPTLQAPPQASSGKLPLAPPPPPSVARKLATQRILSLNPGAPTSGPSPGAGRLQNAIMKPVI